MKKVADPGILVNDEMNGCVVIDKDAGVRFTDNQRAKAKHAFALHVIMRTTAFHNTFGTNLFCIKFPDCCKKRVNILPPGHRRDITS